MPHFTHPKITRSHTTITPAAQTIVAVACALPAVTKVALGMITPVRVGQPTLKIIPEGPGCLFVKVRGTSSVQELWIYTTEHDAVAERLMRAAK